jgi:bleomycin hydrolase
MMQEVWKMITAVLGVPPSPDESFKWEYNDKNDKAHVWEGTPKEFYKKFRSNKYPVCACKNYFRY